MTFREWGRKYLEERGMFEQQARIVLEDMEADPANEAMAGRWKDHIEGYPTSMLAVMAVALNRAAVEWIDANLPKAWYRPMFAN